MERTHTFFISDLHLGAAYISDHHAHERCVVSFLRAIAPRARAVYLMGDVLDYWFEYKTVVPRGFARFFGALAELADAGVEVHWFIGNHDIWTFGYLEHELGVKVHDGSLVARIDGARFYLAHGDGVGRRPWKFRFIRSLFRCRLCQRLYGAVNPRWTIPLAHGWSSNSRNSAPECCLFEPEADSYVEFARSYLQQHPDIDYFVFGHKHLVVDYPLSPSGARLIVLGDWITRMSYAEWDGMHLRMRFWDCYNI